VVSDCRGGDLAKPATDSALSPWLARGTTERRTGEDMAGPAKTVPRPWRALTALVALIVIMLVGILGGSLLRPAHWHQDFKVSLGLDLSSGTQVTMQAATPTGGNPSSAEMNEAKSIILARINGSGNSGAVVQTEGSRDLNVSVPGRTTEQTEDLVKTTALMTFRQVLLYQQYSAPAASSSSAPAISNAYGDTSLVGKNTLGLFDKLVCKPGDGTRWKTAVGYTTPYDFDNPNVQVVSCDNSGDKFVLDKAVVPGTQIGSATATVSNTNQWEVDLTLKSTGSAAFAKLTAQQATDYWPNASTNADDAELDRVAIVLDGNVVTAPETKGSIPGGNFTISGGFTQTTATNLQNVLKYGSLPLNFNILSVQSISAVLGRAYLDGGLIAGAIGLGLVVIYSFLYYRGLGLVSVSSLLIAAGLAMMTVVLLSKHQGFTLDLSGIAGLIVAIGITADSFVVFFERLRDEVREGKQLRPAVESGWKRARRTILVSDTVSFIAALLLYYFSIGEVKGFAFTLGLTTVIDIVVVFLFTKPMMTLLARTRFFGDGRPMSGLDPARLGARASWRSSAVSSQPGRGTRRARQ
jgi:preprotein translocase subunit SecD